MKDHLAKEDHFKQFCLYCGKSAENAKWLTHHHREVLYKISHCECGKKAMIRMPFFGSGHDSLSRQNIVPDKHECGKGTKLRTLEHKIKLLSGEKKG
jgi:hypothetical protein